MLKPIQPKETLAIRCPTCGSAPGLLCQVSIGLARLHPHLAREIAALDEPSTMQF